MIPGKYNSFRAHYQFSKTSVGCFAGGNRPTGGTDRNDVLVATIEKANSIINQMTADETIEQLGCVVIDEIHLVGEVGRGFTLELLCTKGSKTLYRPRVFNTCDKALQHKHIQIVGMSATVPNLEQLGGWLSAAVYRTNFRPVPLEVSLCFKGAFYTVKPDAANSLKFSRKAQGQKQH